MIIFKKIGAPCWKLVQNCTHEQLGMIVSGIAIGIIILAIA
jgi:hypothetical protein